MYITEDDDLDDESCLNISNLDVKFNYAIASAKFEREHLVFCIGGGSSNDHLNLSPANYILIPRIEVTYGVQDFHFEIIGLPDLLQPREKCATIVYNGYLIVMFGESLGVGKHSNSNLPIEYAPIEELLKFRDKKRLKEVNKDASLNPFKILKSNLISSDSQLISPAVFKNTLTQNSFYLLGGARSKTRLRKGETRVHFMSEVHFEFTHVHEAVFATTGIQAAVNEEFS